MSRTEKALAWYTTAIVKRYRDEHLCSLMEAKRHCIDLTISEALKVAHGWEDLKAIMQFQHTYKGYTL
jgi:hypothetical protein